MTATLGVSSKWVFLRLTLLPSPGFRCV